MSKKKRPQKKRRPQKKSRPAEWLEVNGYPQGLRSRLKRAERLHTRGEILRKEGKHGKAEPLFAESWRTLQGLPDLADIVELRTTIALNLGGNLSEGGERERAQTFFAEEVAWITQLTPSGDIRLHRAMLQLSWLECLHALGRHEASLVQCDAALASLDGADDKELARHLREALHALRVVNLAALGRIEETDEAFGNVDPQTLELASGRLCRVRARIERAGQLQKARDHAGAERLYNQALRTLEGEPAGAQVLDYTNVALMNRAGCRIALGRDEEIERQYEDIFAQIARELDSSMQHYHRVGAYINKADAYGALQKWEPAVLAVREALRLLEECCDTPELQRARVHAATIYAQALEKCESGEDAEQWHRRAEAFGENIPDEPVTRVLRANVHTAHAVGLAGRGLYAEAEHQFAKAWELIDGLDESPEVDAVEAQIMLNWAAVIVNQGHYERAEPFFEFAQQLYERLPSSRNSETGRAHVRWNRANNLMRLARWEDARTLYEEADEIVDCAPHSSYAQEFHGLMLMSRAAALRDTGHYTEAEPMFAEAQRIIDDGGDLPSRAMVRIMQAGTRSRQSGQDASERLLGEALELLANAQGSHPMVLYAAIAHLQSARHRLEASRFNEALACTDAAADLLGGLPDSDRTRAERLELLTIRVECLVGLGDLAQAWSTWRAAHEALGELQDAPGVDVVGNVFRCATAFFMLARAGDSSTDDCADAADSLALWSLDRMDLAEPGTAFMYSHVLLERFVHEYLCWLVDTGCVDRIAPLLSEFFGRYSSAEREGRSATEESPSIAKLRLDIRTLNGKIAVVQYRRGDHDEERDRLMEDRRAACAALRELRRAELDREAPNALYGITRSRLAAATTDAAVALVVMCRVSRPHSKHDESDARDVRAIAVVIRASMVPRVVMLSDVVVKGMKAYATRDAGALGALRELPATRAAAISAPAEAELLREAVEDGWAALAPSLEGAEMIYLALHQELAQLPWPAGLPAERAVRVRMFHGVRRAVEALERATTQRSLAASEHSMCEPAERIAPPDTQRPIAVLAHSPARGEALVSIPCVYADCAVTRELWPDAHAVVDDPDLLLNTPPAIVQISSHGNATQLLTGPDQRTLTPFELAHALDALGTASRPDALLAIACSTGQADTAWFGEARGWSAYLHDRVRVILGALYAIDDHFATLFVLLLHRAWKRCGDLRLALEHCRERLRTGDWCENEREGEEIQSLWIGALEAAARHTGELSDTEPRAKVVRCYQQRRELYAQEARLRALTLAFVMFG